MKLKIHKGATVEVTTGQDKGKRGEVLAIDPVALRIRVAGVRVQTKHSKQNGLQKNEGFIDYSNVKLVSAAAKKAGKKTKSAKEKSA